MSAWFGALPMIEKAFIYVAMPATVILIVQTVLLLFTGAGGDSGDSGLDSDTSGMGGDAPGDISFDGGEQAYGVTEADFTGGDDSGGKLDSYGLRFLTTRGVIAFFTVSGWTGVLCMELHIPGALACLIAMVCGVGAMVGIGLLVQSMMNLQSSGNINYRHALGRLADVYLTIPAEGTGIGKVCVTLNGALKELDAMTECHYAIRTGSLVRVTDVVRENVLVVEPAGSELDPGLSAKDVSRAN